MKKTPNADSSAPPAPNAAQEGKPHITSLPKMEMYAVLGLELSKQILERIQAVEDSLEILARQNARDLKTDRSQADRSP